MISIGAKLALEAVAFANSKGIQPVPRCLLLWMALRALDPGTEKPGQVPRLSFMGRSELALGIGRILPDREPPVDAPEALRREWSAGDQAVGRALRALKLAKAIEEVGGGHNGRTIEYKVCLGEVTERSPSPSLNEPVDLRPVKNAPSLTVGPRRTGEAREVFGEEHHLERAPHLRPVDRSDVAI